MTVGKPGSAAASRKLASFGGRLRSLVMRDIYEGSPIRRRELDLFEQRRGGPPRVMLLYWGRRGLTQLALEMARTALADKDLDVAISVSRQNERFEAFRELGPRVFAVDTFSTNIGALTQAWRLPQLRRDLISRLRLMRAQAVIELIPHVWSPFLVPSIKASGTRFITIVHDADSHPGDYRTRLVKGLLDYPMKGADRVITLSKTVADRLAAKGSVPRRKLTTIFHPSLSFGPMLVAPAPEAGVPLRLLFLGRIMPYKGLDLFLDMVDLLRADGLAVEIGVFGEGSLGSNAQRLTGAEVVNRWLSESEIAAILPRFHAIVLSHTEASQSGIAAIALGSGLPVVATPVGGIQEQIIDGSTGILSASVDARSLAEGVKRLLLDPALYGKICHGIARTQSQRSVGVFVRECVSQALETISLDVGDAR